MEGVLMGIEGLLKGVLTGYLGPGGRPCHVRSQAGEAPGPGS